jgi:hypothetical protein
MGGKLLGWQLKIWVQDSRVGSCSISIYLDNLCVAVCSSNSQRHREYLPPTEHECQGVLKPAPLTIQSGNTDKAQYLDI